jgi:hypothetical protein
LNYRILVSYSYEILDELGQEVGHYYGYCDPDEAAQRGQEDLLSSRDDVEDVEVIHPDDLEDYYLSIH